MDRKGDHSKWAVSDAPKNWICFSDLNRHIKHDKTGGTIICLENSYLAEKLRFMMLYSVKVTKVPTRNLEIVPVYNGADVNALTKKKPRKIKYYTEAGIYESNDVLPDGMDYNYDVIRNDLIDVNDL